jgi:hypothetical protein
MQVLCKRTGGHAETRCCVCGQGFVMFWDRQSRSARVEALKEIQDTLRHQHRNQLGKEAHPDGGFLVPEWKGVELTSGVATVGHAPNWEL